MTMGEIKCFSDWLFVAESLGLSKEEAVEFVMLPFQWGISVAFERMRQPRPAPADAPAIDPAQLTLAETPKPATPKRKKSEPAKGLHRMPADFELTDDMRCFAAERAFPPAAISGMWLKFTNHYRANGATAVDWKAKWRTWVLKTVEFNTRDGRTPSGGDSVSGGFL